MKRLTLVLLTFAVGVAMIAAVSSPGMAQRQPFSVTPTYEDVPYATASDTQKLNIYLPSSGDDGPFPTVIMLHGGAFQFGDKTWIPEPVVRALLNGGYAVVSMNYRLSGEAKFPAAVQEAKAAVRFLRANAANYNLNPVQALKAAGVICFT
jgi:acetyl esterase/lipase